VCETLKNHIAELHGVNKRVYLNKCRFILSRILWTKTTQEKNYIAIGARLRLHANNKVSKQHPEHQIGTLAWYFGGPTRDVSNMLKSLEEWGIIKRYRDEQRGVSARTYKLAEAYENLPISLYPIQEGDGAFAQRFLNLRQERNKAPLVRAVLHTYENYVSISEEGLRYLEGKYSQYAVVNHLAQAWRGGAVFDSTEALRFDICDIRTEPCDIGLMQLFQRQFYASIGKKNGRLDHNLTSLKKEFRKYVLIDGQPMVETDISNSQPTFSIPVLYQKLREMQKDDTYAPPDMLHYETCCQKGLFYEVIADKAGIDISTEESRKAFKKQLNKEVLYCPNNNWNTAIQTAFNNLFPNANRAIRDLKKSNHRTYAIRLQKLESDLMVQCVYKQLVEGGYKVLPLHDAIFCGSEEVKQYSQQLIRQAFIQKHNLTIQFKDEPKEADAVHTHVG
jgi:uncharacterized membrane protein